MQSLYLDAQSAYYVVLSRKSDLFLSSLKIFLTRFQGVQKQNIKQVQLRQ